MMENIYMMIVKLLAFILLAAVKESQGSFRRYIAVPVPVEKILATGVASKNFSGVSDVPCAMKASHIDVPYPTVCTHTSSGQCLLLNSTYPAYFNRTDSGSGDYKCYIREGYSYSYTVAPPCPATFDWVADVGCVVVVETGMAYPLARASCPGGSQLVSLYSDNFQKLADYVKQKSMIPHGLTVAGFHVGVQRNNLVWTWRTGHLMSGVVATNPWYHTEPNDNSDCARLKIDLSSVPTASLIDGLCSNPSNFVCALQ